MGESNLASNQFPMCSLQSGTLREVMELHREEKREEETRRRRGGVKRGETNQASNQFPKCSPQPRTP